MRIVALGAERVARVLCAYYAAPMTWRPVLTECLSSGTYRTQAQLVEALEARGHVVTQATVSRHLSQIGAQKEGGFYRLPAPVEIGAPVYSVSGPVRCELLVVKTDPAYAAVVAQSIDGADIPGMLGTIAGDDTVFVAFEGADAAVRIRRHLGHA